MKWKNLLLVLQDQGPPSRFLRNFFVTRNAWGLFSNNSHVVAGSGKPKVVYNTKASSVRAAEAMKVKHGVHFSSYKCLFCDGYHIGKNRSNKYPTDTR